MKPDTTTADLIAALNTSAAIHDYGQKDDTKTNPPPPDSIPCTLAGELDTEEDQGEASEEQAEAEENEAEQQEDNEESQKDNAPSESEAEKEKKEQEQQAKDAARWHDYARALATNCIFKPATVAADTAEHADALLAAFKSRFPNA